MKDISTITSESIVLFPERTSLTARLIIPADSSSYNCKLELKVYITYTIYAEMISNYTTPLTLHVPIYDTCVFLFVYFWYILQLPNPEIATFYDYRHKKKAHIFFSVTCFFLFTFQYVQKNLYITNAKR